MTRGHCVRGFAAAAILTAPMASAGTPARDGSGPLDALIGCSDLPDQSARLACFEARVAELKEARRLHSGPFAPGGDRQREQFQEIRSTILSVTALEPGTWLIVLADHSAWQTNDIVRIDPEPGDSVHVTRGSLGSTLAAIGGERAIRVRRLR
jgi:hypothetical protein